MKTLIKIDPERHMHRWYAVGIQGTLVDELVVIYGWGSLNSTFQQWRRIVVGSQEEAEKLFNRMVETRLKRGYVQAAKEMTNPLSTVRNLTSDAAAVPGSIVQTPEG